MANNQYNASQLNAAILAAHAACDGDALVDLYYQAALLKQADGDAEAHAFLLTHAYVFALENGHKQADAMRDELVKLGRETP